MFLLKKIASFLVLPPSGPLFSAIIGILIIRRRPLLGYTLAWLGLVVLSLLSLPVVSAALLSSLQTTTVPPTVDQLAEVQAIVILSAGKYARAPEYGGDTVDELGLERLRYGARLAIRTGLPVAIAGGIPAGGIPLAIAMKAALKQDFGVETQWVEIKSRDTWENARLLGPQLKAAKITKIALVTHAWHMRRAQRAFESEGFSVLPAPTRFAPSYSGSPYEWLPQGRALLNSSIAFHELLGLAVDSIAARTKPTATVLTNEATQ